MKIQANLTRSRVQYDQENEGHLVVSMVAPPMSTDVTRPTLCIVPVIDVSPSMQGSKLAYAQRSILKLIDHLGAGDYCGLIQFSSKAEVLSRPVKMTAEAKAELKRRVGDLRVSSSTNIADAILTGLAVANEMDLSADVLTRVILFTDGEANVGPAIQDQDLLRLVDSNLGVASLSAFGYGLDVRQDLLAEMGRHGKGNYAFVANPDDALSAFGRELGGLISTYAMDLTLQVRPVGGHRITEVISDVDAEESPTGQITLKIPGLLAEETMHVVFRTKLIAQKNAFPRPFNVMDVHASYDTLGPDGKKDRKQVGIKVKVEFVKAPEAQTEVDPTLDAIVGRAEIVRAQIKAEEMAKVQDYKGASTLMRDMAADLSRRGHANLGQIAWKVGDTMTSGSLYAQNAGYRTSLSRGITKGVGVTGYDLSAEADLAALGIQTSTRSTQTTASAFAQGPGTTGTTPIPTPPEASPTLLTALERLKVATAPETPPPAPGEKLIRQTRSQRW